MKKTLAKLSMSDTIISVITVTDNDQDIIEERLREIKRTLSKLRVNFEILIIDNASSDLTVEKIKNLKSIMPYTRILVLSKKYETEIALTSGLDTCIGDYVILFNIYTDPPEIKELLIDKLKEGNDIVIGRSKKDILKQDFLSKIFMTLVEKLSSQGFYYRQNFLTALNRKAINSIMRTRRKSRNLSYISSLIGLKKITIKYQPLTQFKYKLKEENFFEIFSTIVDAVISNSFRPIRFLTFIGMFFSALFLIYVLIITVLVLFFDMKGLAPQGWISVSTVVGSLFFLLFSLLALISEYIIRILNESRNEPFYFISEEISQSTILPKRRSLNVT